MAFRKVEHYNGTRVTVHSKQSFRVTLAKVYESIGTPDKASAWPSAVKSILADPEEAQSKLTTLIEKTIGAHGFMIFQEFNHGAWVPLWNVGGGMQVKRIILGNPLIAITMLKHDLTAGLAVPVELLVLEKSDAEGGGVDLIYHLPSALIAGLNRDPALVKAAEVLDAKLSEFVDCVAT